ncbi:MAG: hypothetical protein AB7K36_18275 [Chloroflexota bacterium]
MNEFDREFAEAILRHRLVGAQIGGIRFGPILQLLIDDHRTDGRPQPEYGGQIYVNLGARWTVFPSRPDLYPERQEDIAPLSEDEQLVLLCRLREKVICAVDIGKRHPDLMFTFDDGQIFFVSGNDDLYEPWDVGVALSHVPSPWLIAAMPSGGLAVWTPDGFVRPSET